MSTPLERPPPAPDAAATPARAQISRPPDTSAIATDLADLLLASWISPLGNAVAVAMIAAGLLYDRFSPFLIAWAAAGVLLSAARFWVHRSYWRHRQAAIEPDLWLRGAVAIGLTSGCLWGALGLATEIAPTPISALAVPILTLGVSAAFVTANSSHPPMVRGIIYPACVLTAVGQMLHPDLPHIVVAVLGMVVLACLEAMTRRTYRIVVQTLLTKREKERSRDQLARAQKVAATGSAELNLATGVEEWSAELYRLWGADPRSFSVTGANILAAVHAEDRARVAAARQALHAGQGVPPGEFRVVRPDGEVRTLYTEHHVERDHAGKPVRALSIIKDVTALRAAERREQEMERRLLQSQKLEALGTLAGGVAHEINNALVPTIAMTQLVMAKLPEDGRERRSLGTALGGAERVRDLVKQILAFSRQQTPQKAPIDLGAVVGGAVRFMRTTLPATIGIEEHLAPTPPILGDANQVTQVIVNVMANAAHAIGDGIGTITVALGVDGAGMACLTIGDSGCGMDEATRARIFEPFFTTKGVGSGTGLGLSIVHGIVESHGGRIEVASRVGKGTKFTIYLPLIAEEPLAKTPDHADAARDAAAPGLSAAARTRAAGRR